MPSVKQNFVETIRAPVSTVWEVMLGPESFRRWAAEFAPGSYFEGSWEQGTRIRFLAPPSGDGMLSEIAQIRENEFLSIRHVGVVANGVEDTTSEAVRAWAPAWENYTLIRVPEGTRLVVELEIPDEWAGFMGESWPRALKTLKELCESAEAG